MAKPRSKLSELLHTLCGHVYFQPPEGTKLKYPCIIYDLNRTNVKFADNAPYALYDLYSITYITRDPDDSVRNDLVMLPMCTSSKVFITDNLYHHPFDIYW